jgi:hypothetical protein
MKRAAGIHGVTCWPGLATSVSKAQPSAPPPVAADQFTADFRLQLHGRPR